MSISMRIPASLSVISALLVASAARAQTPPPSEPAPAPTPETPPPADTQTMKTVADPSAKLPVPETPPKPEPSWFTRPPFLLTYGEGKAQWQLKVYGFAEFDIMNDSTRSFADGMNSNILARDSTQAGNNGRTQMTIRNTRIGFEGKAPEIGGIRASGRVEGDFFGYDPGPTGLAAPAGAAAPPSEAGFFNNPTWRIRHAYVKLESDVVDLLMGQMYHLFGWQNYFFGTSAAFLGLPNEVFGRTQQIRLSHMFKTDAVNVEIGAAAFRPVQRDSTIPDGEAGIRLLINNWKAINTPGNGGTAAYAAGIGLSGLVRRFKVDQFSGKPTSSSSDTGWAVAADALIPIIPAKDSNDRANALTLTGEFTIGSGYADQFTGMTGGANFPTLPPAMAGGAAVPFNADIDNGLVTYDPSGNGVLHTIDWRTFVVGLQYYVPPGRMIIAVNYTQGDSGNMESLFPKPGTNIIKGSRYGDATIFFDTTPSTRIGVSYQYLTQRYTDSALAQNHRFEMLGLWFF